MTAPERWTAETEELLARAEHDLDEKVLAYREGTQTISWDDVAPTLKDSYRDRAEADLTALADAGLLLPPGGETREVWCVTYLGTLGRDIWSSPTPERAEAEGHLAQGLTEGSRWRGLRLERHTIVTWPDGTVLTGPWIEVPT